jgi:NgoMIV restriction enzyme
LASRNYVLQSLRSNYHHRIAREILNITGGPQLLPIKTHLRRVLVGRNSPVLITVPPGTVLQDAFVEITKDFIQESFQAIKHLRPGEWVFTTSQPSGEVGEDYPADDVRYLQAFLRRHAEVRSAPWTDFFITPDITIGRLPVTDTEIDMEQELVTERGKLEQHTPLRSAVNTRSILHASVSCKWTIRSDRSQTTRTEALNLIRNRKAKVPIVVAVVFEPLPTRIASIALGTVDLDCVYHGALHELREAVEETKNEDQKDMLDTLVQGRRLRDISDLPFDLAT